MENSLRDIIRKAAEYKREKLEYTADYMHRNPEMPLKEDKTCRLLISLLKSEGFEAENNTAGFETAFKAVYGFNRPRIAYICEYEASNEGHVFGNNISSAINAGSAIALKEAVDKIGGSIIVIGCPGESKSPVKIEMLKKGVFDDIDAVICAHAMDKTCESGSSLGMALTDVEFKGKSSHTSINFKEGINALTPLITFFNLIESIKLMYCDSSFINAVINKGMDDINLIPEYAGCSIMIKSKDINILEYILEKIKDCAEFSSRLHNCTVLINKSSDIYLPLKTDENLSRLSCHNLKECGILEIHGPLNLPASLDLGNISHKVPTIQPYIGICGNDAKYYSKEFLSAAASQFAKDQMIKAASALALTGLDIIQKPEILKK